MKKLLMLLLFLLGSQHASGLEVEVYEGVESVLLPCEVSGIPSDTTAAVWDRKDLNIQTVHVRLRSGDRFEDQNINYANRTSMRADALQTGDLSLTLRNPTASDSGNYTCIARSYGRDLSRAKVQLRVKEPPLWPWVLAGALVILVPLVSLAVAFGVSVYREHKRLKDLEGQLLSQRLLRRLHVLFGQR